MSDNARRLLNGRMQAQGGTLRSSGPRPFRALVLLLVGALAVTGSLVAIPSAAQATASLTFTSQAGAIDVSYDSSCEAYGVTTGSYSAGWRALAYGNGVGSQAHGVFLGLRSDGRIFRSLDDGATWSQSGMLKRTPSATHGPCIIRNGWLAYGEPAGVPTWVVALKNEKQIFTSTDDGVTWGVPVETSGEPLKLAYGGGRFLLGYNGGNDSFISTNGVTWSAGGSLTGGGGYPGGSTYGNGQFVIPVGQSSDVCTSADGASFNCTSNALLNDGGDRQWQDIAFGSGILVGAVENGASSTNGIQLQRSTDAITWQAPTSGLSNRVSGVAFGDGFFVAESFGSSSLGGWNATGTTSAAYFSSDGLTWASAGTGSAGRTFIAEYGNKLVFGEHRFVGVGDNGAVSVGVLADIPPGAPTGVSATAGDGQATVTFTAPGSDGGSAITGYTVTSVQDGTKTCTTASTSCTVNGLTNGTSYTFTLTATSANGTGAASSASSAVTPAAPVAQTPAAPVDQGTPTTSAPTPAPVPSASASTNATAPTSPQTIINNYVINNYTIQQLAPSQVATLSAEQISQIAAAVVALLTPSQIAALTPRAFSGIKQDQFRALRPIQIRAITPRQIRALDPEALSTATRLAIASLSANTAVKLTPAQLEALTPQAIRGITRAVYRKMNAAQRQVING